MQKKDNFSREKQRFSIVKVSGKTTSVLVGLTIFGGLLLDTPNVKADTNDNYKIEDVNSTGNSNINDKEVTLSSTNNTVSNTVTNVDESTGKETQNATNENQVTTVDSQVVNNENEVTSSNVNSTDSEVSDVVVNNETTSKELTPTTSHKVVRRSVNTLNTTSGQDCSSGTIDNPTVRSEDGESLIQIEGNKPAKPADAQLVTMYITIKAYGGDVHVNNLKFQINGVNATSDGTTRFKTGISNIDLTKNGEVHPVYIISKNATPEYALAHDDIEGLSADDKLIAYVKSKDTDITNMISNIVIEVAFKPELSTRAEAGYVVQKGTRPLDINQVLSNADTIPDLNWDNYDTSAAGDFTPKIIATYPGASQSWGFEDKVKEEKSINIKVVDVQKSQEEARNTKGTIEYKKASNDKKKVYDEALKKTLGLLTQATPASIEEYNQAQEALNNAKAALDGREQSIKFIDNLTNLNTAQKQELENKINAANTVDEIDKLQADATTLDKYMSDLTTVTSEQDTVKSDKNYTEADPDKKATYDTAIEDAQKVLKENSDSSQIKEALQKIADAKNALNGDKKLKDKKTTSQANLDGLKNLNDAQKAAAKEAIEAATTPAGVEKALATAQELNGKMGELNQAAQEADGVKSSLDYTEADPDKKATYDTAIEDAQKVLKENSDSSQIKEALQKIADAKNALNGDKKLKDKKTTSQANLDGLKNLNDAQKAAAKEAIEAATTPAGVEKALATAQELNGKMGELNQAAQEADGVKSSLDYTEADPDKKATYDTAIEDAQKVLKENSDSSQIKEALQKIADAKNALNGDKKLKDKKTTSQANLDGLKNLNDAQKAAAKEAIEAATTPAGVEKALATAQELNGKMGELNQAAQEADGVKSSLDYTEADPDKKATYDTAIEDAQKVLKENSDSSQIKEALQKIADAKNALNGDKKLKDKKTTSQANLDGLKNLNDAQKAAAKEAIEAATTPAGVEKALATAQELNGKMGELNQAAQEADGVKSSLDYTEADPDKKATYDTAIEDAQKVLKENSDSSQIKEALQKIADAKNALNGDKKLKDKKTTSQANLDGLKNLNDAQKAAAKEAIEAATTPAGVEKALATAQELNGKMGELNQAAQEADGVKSSLDYTEADPDKKATYDTAIEDAQKVLKENSDSSQIKEALQKIADAKNALNGDKKLKDKKTTSQANLDGLKNLNDAQKAAAKEAIEAATTPAGVEKALATAQELNGKMGELNQAAQEADGVKSSLDYTEADPDKKATYDTALTNAQAILDKAQGGNASAAEVQVAKDALELAKSKLNGDEKLKDKKTTAQANLDGLNNLNEAQIAAAKEAIEAATTPAGVEKALATAQKLDGKMGELDQAAQEADGVKSSLDYTNADEAEQQAYDEALSNAQAILDKAQGGNASAAKVQAAKAALELAKSKLNGDEKLKDQKTTAQANLDGLNNLNEAQIAAAKEAIEAATTPAGVEKALATAQELDGKMGELDQAAQEADGVKSSLDYTNADEAEQQAYDEALSNAQAILDKAQGGNASAAKVQAAKAALELAKSKLNGDEKLKDQKTTAQANLDGLNNLNEAQIAAAKEAIEAATTPAGVEKALATAQELDGKMGELDQAAQEADGVKSSLDYTNADEAAQQAYDEALTNAQAILDKAQGGNASAAKVQAAKDALELAKSKLNGDEKLTDQKTTAQANLDGLNNLNEAQKAAAQKAIKTATTPAGVEKALATAQELDGKMGELDQAAQEADGVKSSLDYTNADEAEQQAYDEALSNAQAILDKAQGGNASAAKVQAAKDALELAKSKLNGDEKLTDQKTTAQANLDGLNNLNEAQIAAAKEAIEAATTPAGVEKALATAQELDGKMGELDQAAQEADGVKSSLDYTNADETAQQAYDEALTNAQAILDKAQGGNASAAEVQAAKDALELAKSKLNGDEKLTDQKAKSQAKLDGLNNLNEAQKAAAKEAIETATTPAGVEKALATAQELDGKMGELDQAAQEADGVKSSLDYTNADETAQQAYDEALTNAQAILDKAQGGNASAAEVQAAKDALELAKSKLNGDEKLTDQKAKSQAKLDGLNNLNEAQKAAAKEAIETATTPAGVEKALATAQELDGKMGELDQAAQEADGVKSSLDYTNADETAQQAYDEALTNAQAILDKAKGGNASAAEVQAAKDALELAKSKLNGDEKLTDQKAKSQAKLDGLNNLNEAQKAAAKEAIETATTPAGVEKALATAQELDGKMGELDQAAQEADGVKSSLDYTNADETAQQAYDEALTNAQAILDKAKGGNASAAEVQAAKDALELAKSKLNGDEKLTDQKTTAQANLDGLNNLNEVQKAAAQKAIKTATTPAGVEKALATAQELDGKMGELDQAAQEADGVKSSLDYTNADEAEQQAYDEALTNAQAILDKAKGGNASAAEVQAAKDALELAKSKLNGDEKLTDQKTTAQAKLDGLNNLNDAQKDAFVQSIDNASTPQLVEQALAEAKKVDAEMARLRRELALVDGTKNSVKYTNADTKLRDNYDSLVKVALDLISKDGIDANLATVQELVNELNAARLSLNGKFVETQEVVIDNTTSQNKTQKNRSVVNKSTLPQTGDKEENSSLVGVAFITIAGVLGLGLARRRKEDK